LPFRSPLKTSVQTDTTTLPQKRKITTSTQESQSKWQKNQIFDEAKSVEERINQREKKLLDLKAKYQTIIKKSNDNERLSELTKKWKSVSQEALVELQAQCQLKTSKTLTKEFILQQFHIDPNQLDYIAEVDSFMS